VSLKREIGGGVPCLPEGVTVQQAYRDFIQFLYESGRDWFLSTTYDDDAWERLKDDLVLVFAIPNGWGIPNQHIMRDAVRAAQIPHSDVRFISEAEAAVHYALQHSRDRDWLQVGTCFVVTDAGGSTIDSTMYTCTQTAPRLMLKEAAASLCTKIGAIFVDCEMEKRLKRRLRGMDELPEILSNLIFSFERDAKRRFNGAQETLLLSSGNFALKERGFMKGKLAVTKDELKDAFSLPIIALISQCESLVESPGGPPSVRNIHGTLLL
jgi:hypothetical protein